MEHVLNLQNSSAVYERPLIRPLISIKYYKEYLQHEISFTVSICEKELYFSSHNSHLPVALNACLKKFNKFTKKRYRLDIPPMNILFGLVEKVEKSRPAIGEQAHHWERISPSSWRKKQGYIRATNGKWYYRAECRQDTALHHRNCGSPIPQFSPDLHKWA